MKLQFEIKEEIGVIVLGQRLDAGNAMKFKATFNELTKEHELYRFVFDFSQLEMIDSTGLGAVISCLKTVNQQDGEIKIAALQEKPQMVFQITRAHNVFEIFPTPEEALKSFVAKVN